MISAGNDLIALNTINIHRTNDSRFYSKFITPAELALFQPTLPFEIFVWLLWSVKESAYKYLQRHDAGLIFSPTKFVVEQINIPASFALRSFNGIYWDSEDATTNYITGSVSYGDSLLYFRSNLHHDFIASVVNADEKFKGVYWGVQLIEHTDHQHQSNEVREFTLIKLRSILGIDDLHISKSAVGYPVVIDNGTPLDIAVSFAHHDRWVGYSFLLNQA